jgi:hypothetical protein
MRKSFYIPVLILFIVLTTFVTARTQNIQAQPGASGPHLAVANSTSSARSSLTTAQVQSSMASLPEADLLIYINPQRIRGAQTAACERSRRHAQSV